MFIGEISRIRAHLGKNPKRGGNPPSERNMINSDDIINILSFVLFIKVDDILSLNIIMIIGIKIIM